MVSLLKKIQFNNHKKIYTFLATGLGFILLFFFCYKLAFNTSNRYVSVSVAPKGLSRSLATNRGEKEVVSISYSEFSEPQTVFNKAKVIPAKSSEEMEFLIGNILFTDSKGNKNFVCQNFSEAHLIFEADGIFIEGEKVIMKLVSTCDTYKEHKFIGPFSIPSQLILQSAISQEYFEHKGDEIYFSNVSLQWPRDWILMEINFKNPDSNESLRVIKKFSKKENQFFTISL